MNWYVSWELLRLGLWPPGWQLRGGPVPLFMTFWSRVQMWEGKQNQQNYKHSSSSSSYVPGCTCYVKRTRSLMNYGNPKCHHVDTTMWYKWSRRCAQGPPLIALQLASPSNHALKLIPKVNPGPPLPPPGPGPGPMGPDVAVSME